MAVTSRRRRDASTRAAKRAQSLIEHLFREMQRGLKDPAHHDPNEWNRLFGAKQSMVMNIQKLVAALAALPEPPPEEVAETPMREVTDAELSVFKAWLDEGWAAKN